MHRTSSPLAARRRSKRPAALWLAVLALPLLGAGCTTTAPEDRTRFACYDVRGRIEPTIATRAECERREWNWRERQ
jgi:hypothetical protein